LTVLEKSGGHIRVTLAGKVIEEGTIANTFVEALKVFGFERVARLNKIASGIPLFAKNTHNQLSNATTHRGMAYHNTCQ
jgi:23S rRNA-/tRNA-specific pseudouridylate synthase